MAIPEAQLDTWSNQGSITQSKNTYATIKNALEARGTPYAGKEFESFLQGSYGNDTNIFADSDVDIVMKLDSTFYRDLSRLSAADRAAYEASFSTATYSYSDFKTGVLAALRGQFGDDVSVGNKAIWIRPNGGRRNADVLVATQFRRYYRFTNHADQNYGEGICFFLSDGTMIENFPKQHSNNCTEKHQATRQWFKPIIRAFKNARNRMIERGMIAEGVAPSHYIQGLLYNVPNDRFGGSYSKTFLECLNWAWQADKSTLTTASGMHWLVRDSERTSWPTANCQSFLNKTVELWNGW
jgi:hypothetical protein